jgi:hypothetical protein
MRISVTVENDRIRLSGNVHLRDGIIPRSVWNGRSGARHFLWTGAMSRRPAACGTMLIGRRVKGGAMFFDGQLDDIWNCSRALSAEEITTLAGQKNPAN